MTKILMVCLGNICRSPLAEGILREKAKKNKLDIFIDSAGTSDWHIGESPDKRTQKNALKHGIDLSKLRGRQFEVNDFDEFDLIFTMDSSNYSNVIHLARNEDDKNKVEMILNRIEADSYRSVPDPYFGGEEGFEHVFQLLDKACEEIIKSLQS